MIEKKAIVNKFTCQDLFRPLLLRTCPSGEIGRHRGFKIPRPQSVPVRVWPRAPFNESNHSNGANKELQHYAGFFMPKKYNIENNNIYVPMI